MPVVRKPPRRGWHLERPRGAAIIVALLAVAVVAALATTMLARLDARIELASDREDLVQARQLALSAIDLARITLDADARATRIDWLGEPWAQPQQPALHPGARIRLTITDASGDAALNEMLRAPARGERGVATPQPDTPAPLRVPVNINTAPTKSLQVILPGSTPAQAQAVARMLRMEPATSIRSLGERLPEGLDLPAADRVGVSSDYFIADVVVEYGVAVSTLEALLVRTGERVSVLSLRSR